MLDLGIGAESVVLVNARSRGGGWGIIDFWEARADFDAFAPRIVEGMAAAGIETQPDIKEFPVHEVIGA